MFVDVCERPRVSLWSGGRSLDLQVECAISVGGPALIRPLERQRGVRRLMGRSLLSLLFIFNVPPSLSPLYKKTLGSSRPLINQPALVKNERE